MKRKLLSKTYLRNVSEYNLNMYMDKDDYYLAAKKIIKTDEPYVLKNGLCVMDNNYYVVEVLPKNEKYTMRVFFNEKKERLYYYFDMTYQNGLDKDTNIPFYDDLYLDVTLTTHNNNIDILDEDELLEALNTNDITEESYKLAYKTKDKIVESINLKNNKYMKLDLEQYINKL